MLESSCCTQNGYLKENGGNGGTVDSTNARVERRIQAKLQQSQPAPEDAETEPLVSASAPGHPLIKHHFSNAWMLLTQRREAPRSKYHFCLQLVRWTCTALPTLLPPPASGSLPGQSSSGMTPAKCASRSRRDAVRGEIWTDIGQMSNGRHLEIPESACAWTVGPLQLLYKLPIQPFLSLLAPLFPAVTSTAGPHRRPVQTRVQLRTRPFRPRAHVRRAGRSQLRRRSRALVPAGRRAGLRRRPVQTRAQLRQRAGYPRGRRACAHVV